MCAGASSGADKKCDHQKMVRGNFHVATSNDEANENGVAVNESDDEEIGKIGVANDFREVHND